MMKLFTFLYILYKVFVIKLSTEKFVEIYYIEDIIFWKIK